MGTTHLPSPNQEPQAPELPNKSRKETSKIAVSILLGFALALVAMGLPMIGFSVNIYLGAGVLLLAFACFAFGIWVWETAGRLNRRAKGITLAILGLIYFVLIGYQIRIQYKKDHQPTVATVAHLQNGGGGTGGTTAGTTTPENNNGTKKTAKIAVAHRKPKRVPPDPSETFNIVRLPTIGAATEPAQALSVPLIGHEQRCETGSLCNQDTVVDAPQTVINNKPLLPEVYAGPSRSIPVQAGQINSPKHPRAAVLVTVKGTFINPAFVADCDVPCFFAEGAFPDGFGGVNGRAGEFVALRSHGKSGAGAMLQRGQIPAGTRLVLLFESQDDRLLNVTNVRPFAVEDIKPQ